MMEYALIGNHPSIQKIRELIQMVSDTGFNVLVLGETGTGKEVVARLLHQASPRKAGRFVKVNCAALPLTLLESELFGYERGAFTGADRLKPGKFELASQGVILLDEIGDMPMVLQAKLLHVLQSGEFTRLGGTTDLKVKAWIICSTNHDMEGDMKQGLFREDLYYRINVIKIEMPPLRDRQEDIPLLTDHLLKTHLVSLGMDGDYRLGADMKGFFHSYDWPGNVRELSNMLLRLLVGDDPEQIRAEVLEQRGIDDTGPADESLESAKTAEGGDPGDGDSEDPKSLKEIGERAAHQMERKAIVYAMNASGWNKVKAADLLKISYKTLFSKMNSLGIGKEKGLKAKGTKKMSHHPSRPRRD